MILIEMSMILIRRTSIVTRIGPHILYLIHKLEHAALIADVFVGFKEAQQCSAKEQH
jgi:hypothetical protein